MVEHGNIHHRHFMLLSAAASLLPELLAAEEVWTDPYPGIEYLFETREEPLEIHVFISDFTHPAISVQVTGEDRKDSVASAFAKSYGLAVAVNGDYFEPWPHYNVLPTMPLGLCVSEGQAYSNTKDQLYGNLIAFSKDNDRVEIINDP